MSAMLVGPDGRIIELDEHEREFARAMAEPTPDTPAAPAPPKIDPAAPFGYNKKTGEPNKRRPGPGKPPRARVQSGASGDAGGTPETPQDRTQRRTDGVKGLVQTAAAGCLAVSLRAGDAWKA